MLPALLSVYFHFLNPRLGNQLLSPISAPKWTSLECYVVDGGDEHFDSHFTRFLTPSVTAKLTSVKNGVMVRLDWATVTLEVSAGDGDEEGCIMTVEPDGGPAPFFLQRLVPLLEDHLGSQAEVTMAIQDGSLADDDVLDSLPRMLAKVTTLKFLDCRGLDRVIGALSSPKVDGGWMCPHLKHLEFTKGVTDRVKLLGMTEARSQAYREWITSEPEGSQAPPVNLENLLIRTGYSQGMDTQTFESIKAIVGAGATWENEEASDDEE